MGDGRERGAAFDFPACTCSEAAANAPSANDHGRYRHGVALEFDDIFVEIWFCASRRTDSSAEVQNQVSRKNVFRLYGHAMAIFS